MYVFSNRGPISTVYLNVQYMCACVFLYLGKPSVCFCQTVSIFEALVHSAVH